MAHTIDVLVILGAGGDLTSRLLLPGLGQLLSAGGADGLELIGVGQETETDAQWRAVVADSFSEGGAQGPQVSRVAASARWLTADVTDAGELERVLGEIKGTPAFYFALPPSVAF